MHVSIPFRSLRSLHSISTCIKLFFLKIDQTPVIIFLIKLTKNPQYTRIWISTYLNGSPRESGKFVSPIFHFERIRRNVYYLFRMVVCLYFYRICQGLSVAMIFVCFYMTQYYFQGYWQNIE